MHGGNEIFNLLSSSTVIHVAWGEARNVTVHSDLTSCRLVAVASYQLCVQKMLP